MTKRKTHETIAADAAGRGQYILAEHRWELLDDGALEHTIDGQLRAWVEPEHVRDYLVKWPDAAAALLG
jgi:hypothetical protein